MSYHLHQALHPEQLLLIRLRLYLQVLNQLHHLHQLLCQVLNEHHEYERLSHCVRYHRLLKRIR